MRLPSPVLAVAAVLAVIIAVCAAPRDAQAQTLQWEKRYNHWPTYNVYRNDNPTKVATDAQGNVYVTGAVFAGSADYPLLYNQDWVTIKYSPAGAQLWLKKYEGGPGYAEPCDMAVDAQGNCYVTGYADEPTGDHEDQCVTIKYTSGGGEAWVKPYDAPNVAIESDEEGRAVTVDAQGNVYVAGQQYTGGDFAYDGVVLKYTSAGALAWSHVYDNEAYAGGGFEYLYDIALDNAGGVVVAGSAENTVNGAYARYDVLALKLNAANGARLWAKLVNGAGNSTDNGDYIAVDAQNNVYIAGYVTDKSAEQGGSGSQDLALFKWNAAGTLQWSRFHNGSGSISDYASGLAVDAQNNVFFAGTVYNTFADGYYNMRVAKYSGTGALLWASEYNDAWDWKDYCDSLTLDAKGDVYLAGTSDVGFTPDNEDFDTNVSVVKYNGLTGGEAWRYSYAGVDLQLQDSGGFVAVDPAASGVVVGCSSWGYENNELSLDDYATFKLSNGVGRFVPRDLAVGPDGKARMTWTRNGDRQVAAWTLNAAGTGIETGKAFTAPAGYQPRFVTTGDDNKPRVLLTGIDDKVIVWRLNAASTAIEATGTFGPAVGYTVRDFAVGPDGKSYIAWEKNDTHQTAIWRFNAAGTTREAGYAFGPYPDLTPAQIAVGADNKVRLLWKNRANGQATLWRLNAGASAPEVGKVFNAPAGYALTGMSVGGDNKARLLWRKTENNALAVWTLTATGTAVETGKTYNPLAGATPYQFITGRTDNKSRVLWTLPNNRAALWTIGTTGAIETGAFFGPY